MNRTITTSAESTSHNRARVLVIDDDASVRSLLVAVLKRNYLVVVANDGLSGFTKAKEYPPDIAVIDIQMPGWDGLQTLAAFRKEPSLTHVRTIVLTSDASRDTVLAAVQAGANDYMIKTAFSREEFDRKIAKLLQRNDIEPKSNPRTSPPSYSQITDSSMPFQPVPFVVNEAAPIQEQLNTIEPDVTPLQPQFEEINSPQTISDSHSPTASEVTSSDLQEVLDAWE